MNNITSTKAKSPTPAKNQLEMAQFSPISKFTTTAEVCLRSFPHTTAARANHKLHMNVFVINRELANQQIYFSDLKENLDGKLLTRILEVDARMGNLEKVMELIRCCKGVIDKCALCKNATQWLRLLEYQRLLLSSIAAF
ncbi:hypothetical protein DY000_02013107 [Brassica cretica]|uniref:Uncharacterized protein n=1 Tax=Brassica cretica TaxID=69181 RepID=A0ABQ7CRU5_BRACR|nr:hypothetical protein DY000_02013107 [Brassica cretica]